MVDLPPVNVPTSKTANSAKAVPVIAFFANDRNTAFDGKAVSIYVTTAANWRTVKATIASMCSADCRMGIVNGVIEFARQWAT
jgi:hypothetical protein